jgi:hypothetical protein
MPDPNVPLPGETLMEYLVRTRPEYEWAPNSWDGEPEATIELGGSWPSTARVRPRLTTAEWGAYVSIIYPAAPPVLVPPIWPGLEAVTLGAEVALDRTLTITAPMDGVIVAITAVAPKQMFYTYDDVLAYRHVGALAFVSDRGDVENWQALGFQEAVYVPRMMAHASAVKLFTPGGTEGTIRPWTLAT